MPDSYFAPFPLRVYAHRGASLHAPENTLLAFAAAVDAGVRHLETDVHRSLDDQIVVFHDPSGLRTAGIDQKIRDHTLEELRAWDAGYCFEKPTGNFPFRGQGLSIPTLAEMLRRFPDCFINIDIKQHDQNTVRLVVETIREQEAEERVLLSSFEPDVTRWVRELDYRGPAGVTRGAIALLLLVPGFLLSMMPASIRSRNFPPGAALQIPRNWKRHRFDRRDFIQKAHRYGLRVDYWVVNEVDEALHLLELGADGIMTDDPALIMPAVRAFAEKKNRRIELVD